MSTGNTEKTIKVTLAKDGLTYKGKERAQGTVIEVTESQLAFLIERGYVVDAAGKAGAKPPASETK